MHSLSQLNLGKHMGQTLLRLKQLEIGTKQPKKFNFTLIYFSNNVNMLDLSKYLSRHWTTYPILSSSVKH